MGRRPIRSAPQQPLLSIASRHREIMRRLVAGEKQCQIAAEMGITEGRLSIICRSPLFVRELEALEREVKGRFIKTSGDIALRVADLVPDAVGVLEKIIRNSKIEDKVISPALKKETALDVLELAGSGKRNAQKSNTDAMADVVHIIREGFTLAKEAHAAEMERMRQENEDKKERNVTPSSTDVVDIEAISETTALVKVLDAAVNE